MITLRQIAAIAIVASFFACGQVQAETPAKLTLVDGTTIEANISDRSSEEAVYVVFRSSSVKVVRKIDRSQIVNVERLEVAPLQSTARNNGQTVAERALAAIRHGDVGAIAAR